MKTTISVLFASLCLGLTLTAQEQNSLLWKVSGNGLESPSYLYGTIHMICPDDLVISEETMKALSESEQLVLELDMDEPGFMMEMQKYAFNPGMTNISEDLSEEDQATINEFFVENYGAGLDQLGVMRPFALLSMALVKGIDCAAPASVEGEFLEYAAEQEWEVLGLETIEEQMAVISEASQEEQIEWLLSYIEEEGELTSRMNELIQIYLSQDLSAMADYMSESPEMSDGMAEALLNERNENWIEPMIEFAEAKSTFFAVGAGHLGGDDGLIALLKAEGYSVEPLH